MCEGESEGVSVCESESEGVSESVCVCERERERVSVIMLGERECVWGIRLGIELGKQRGWLSRQDAARVTCSYRAELVVG